MNSRSYEKAANSRLGSHSVFMRLRIGPLHAEKGCVPDSILVRSLSTTATMATAN
jgi:hypothetical protein